MGNLDEKDRIARARKLQGDLKWADGYDGGGDHPLPQRDRRQKAVRANRGWDPDDADAIRRIFGKHKGLTAEEWANGFSADGKWRRVGGKWRKRYG